MRPMSNFIFAAKVTDVAEGEIFATEIDDTPIALTRIDDAIYAFGDVCTHDDGPLAEGHIESSPGGRDRCVICPRHGARFDLSTGKPTFPAVTPIPIYETRIEGDEIQINLG